MREWEAGLGSACRAWYARAMNARFGRSVRSLAPLAGGTRSLLEALEPRQLLASTFSGTDVDGDTYVVEVLGNGSAAVTTSGGGTSGFLETVALSGTDLNSTLRITVTQAGGGNGELLLRGLTVGNLGAMNAPKVNADNDAVWTFGQVKSIIANDMTDIDMAINGPAATKVALKFRTVDQLLLDSSQRVSTYAANLDFGAQLNFDEGVDKVTVTTDMAGDVVVTGPAKVSIGQVVVGGVLDGDLQVPNEIGSVLEGVAGFVVAGEIARWISAEREDVAHSGDSVSLEDRGDVSLAVADTGEVRDGIERSRRLDAHDEVMSEFARRAARAIRHADKRRAQRFEFADGLIERF